MNNHLLLVSGASTTGKSWSLKYLANQPGVMYLCTESNKALPFKHKFLTLNITEPYMVHQAFDEAEEMPDVHTIVVDSLTFMMDQAETQMVQEVDDPRSGWGDFSEFFKKLMLSKVASSTKNVIFTAHTINVFNKNENIIECKVPVKGALKNNGIESYFSTVISTKRMQLEELEDYESDLLTITEMEEELGFKNVFQTRLTRDTVNERIRSPDLMWAKNETFIDNNLQLVLDRLDAYYKP